VVCCGTALAYKNIIESRKKRFYDRSATTAPPPPQKNFQQYQFIPSKAHAWLQQRWTLELNGSLRFYKPNPYERING